MQVMSERDARLSYDEMLDECYPEVVLGYSTFSASDVLKTMDPVAYRVGFSEYCDNAAEDESFLVEGYTDHLLEEVEEE